MLLLQDPLPILVVDIAVLICHCDISHPFYISVMDISVSICQKGMFWDNVPHDVIHNNMMHIVQQ